LIEDLESSSRILSERPVTASENNCAGIVFDTFVCVLNGILIFQWTNERYHGRSI